MLLDNFRDFIARAGFRILLVPDTPKEFVGQHLLYVYLDQFVQLIHGHIYLEGQTGRGKIDLAIFHNAKKYIVETKIWEGPRAYQSGKKQLAAYLKLEGVSEGYYVVFGPSCRAGTPRRNRDDRRFENPKLRPSRRPRSPFTTDIGLTQFGTI